MKLNTTTPAPNLIKVAAEFFYHNAGWSTPPGREACAIALAQAESKAASLGFTFDWEVDLEGCIGCDCGNPDCACASGESHETLACVCRNAQGEVCASLSGICGCTRAYKRVVEAELASESLAD